ncbi:MAG: T9SS type A sorting domain-containing protein [Bacteroidetes bacterium]|nr:T9SS type A sorting domain-containing protein [Bacteroidota bacterium]
MESVDTNNNLKCANNNYVYIMMTLEETPFGFSCQTVKEAFSVKLYPNPASEELYIELEEPWRSEQITITIYQASGTKIYTSRTKHLSCHIATANWPPGLYYVEIVQGPQKVIQKVIKL